MFIFFWCILFLSSGNVISGANDKAKEGQKVADEGSPYDYNEIVRNMIRSWEAPVVYLRRRGFLPSDYQDTSKIKPSLDALMQRLDKGKREAKNHVDEEMRSRRIKAISKEKKFAWEQLQSLSSKFTGNKNKTDERAAKLMAMKRRLEQLEIGLDFSPQLPEIQMSAKMPPVVKYKEPSEQKYDDTLQRMIEKTNPYSGRHPSFGLQSPKAPPPSDDSPVTSAPISLSTYGARSFLSNRIDNSEIHTPRFSPPGAQEGNGREASPSLKSGLGAPKYLSWDMKAGRLDNFSRYEKEAYLNKLLKAYSLDSMETRNPSTKPMGASELAKLYFPHLRNFSMTQRPFGFRANDI